MTGNCLMVCWRLKDVGFGARALALRAFFRNDLLVGVGEALSFCGPDEMCEGTLRGTLAFEDE